jgi:hypothetical protein
MTGVKPNSGEGGFNQAGDADAYMRAMEQQRYQQAEAQRAADAQAQQAAVAQSSVNVAPSPAATMTPSQPPTMFRENTYNSPMANNQAPITFNPGSRPSRFTRRATKGRGR